MGVGEGARHKGQMRRAWPAIVICPLYPRPATVPPIPQSFSSLVPRIALSFFLVPTRDTGGDRAPRRLSSTPASQHAHCETAAQPWRLLDDLATHNRGDA